MKWLANDVARCHGVLTEPFMQGSQPRDVEPQCKTCLRHTAPASSDRVAHQMPTEFEGACPDQPT